MNSKRPSVPDHRRRRLLGLMLAGSALPWPSLANQLISTSAKGPLLLSAVSDRRGQHWAISSEYNGHVIAKTALPARAHEVVPHPIRDEVCIVARRPGNYLMIKTARSQEVSLTIAPQAGFHFYGHATYSADGRFLFTTENHIESGQGYIFVRDTNKAYQVHQYFPSFGIGPHEVKLSHDQKTLIVANGGILTHPDKGREKLNLDSMKASLVYIDLETGQLLEQHSLAPELHQLSIRHIDLGLDDKVIIAMQYQGDRTDDVPLVGIHTRGDEIKFMRAPEAIHVAMRQYCGSVCVEETGQYAAISSPKGDLITFWDLQQQGYAGSLKSRDACGLASNKAKEFLISNGRGRLLKASIDSGRILSTPLTKLPSLVWDNHLALINSG